MKKTVQILTLMLVTASIALVAFACAPPHAHTYTESFMSDDTAHWQELLCGHGDDVPYQINYAEHVYGDGTVVDEATCEYPGRMSYECSVCGYVKYEDTELAEHDYTHYGAKQSTCTENGWNEYDECNVCGYSTKQELPLSEEHAWEKNDYYIEPTCQNTGTQGYSCQECGNAKFEDIDTVECEFVYDCTAEDHTLYCKYCYTPDGDWEKHDYDSTNTCSICSYTLVCADMTYELSEDGTYYTLTEGHATRNQTYDDIIVPPYYNGLPVKYVGAAAFKGIGDHFDRLYTFDNLVGIGEDAFNDVDLIRWIILPKTLKTVGPGAFDTSMSRDNWTTQVEFGGTVAQWMSIDFKTEQSNPMHGGRAGRIYFASGEDITELTLPDGTTSVAPYVFAGCKNIEKLILPEGLRSIGASAFSYTRMTELVIPDSVTEIGENAFYSSYLYSVTLGRGVENIGYSAFSCDHLFRLCNLSNLQITAGDTIRNGAIGSALIDIVTDPDAAFNLNTDERGFVFYKSVSGDTYLVDYTGAAEENLVLPDGYGDSKTYAVHNRAVYRQTKTVTLTVPDTVTVIGEAAFIGCTKLEKVTLGNGVEVIGDYAFANLYALTSFSMGNGVKVIGEGAFYACGALTEIALSESLKVIGEQAFFWCDSLDGIIVPSGVTSLNNVFTGCYLKWIVVGENVENFKVVYGWSLDNSLKIYLTCDQVPDSWDESWKPLDYPVYFAGEWELEQGKPVEKQ